MNEQELIDAIQQVDFDLAFLKKRIRILDVRIAEARLENNTTEINRQSGFKRQQERYIKYAKSYRRELHARHSENLAEWKRELAKCAMNGD